MGIKHHIKLELHKSIFLATSVTKTLDHNILTDGYYFGTITELLVLPEYQKQGVGSKLLQLAKDNTPTMLYFGAQPGIEKFYEKNGCKRSLQSYVIEKERS